MEYLKYVEMEKYKSGKYAKISVKSAKQTDGLCSSSEK